MGWRQPHYAKKPTRYTRRSLFIQWILQSRLWTTAGERYSHGAAGRKRKPQPILQEQLVGFLLPGRLVESMTTRMRYDVSGHVREAVGEDAAVLMNARSGR